jgi:hypothetical protein
VWSLYYNEPQEIFSNKIMSFQNLVKVPYRA